MFKCSDFSSSSFLKAAFALAFCSNFSVLAAKLSSDALSSFSAAYFRNLFPVLITEPKTDDANELLAGSSLAASFSATDLSSEGSA